MERSSQGLSSEKGPVDLRFDIQYQHDSQSIGQGSYPVNEEKIDEQPEKAETYYVDDDDSQYPPSTITQSQVTNSLNPHHKRVRSGKSSQSQSSRHSRFNNKKNSRNEIQQTQDLLNSQHVDIGLNDEDLNEPQTKAPVPIKQDFMPLKSHLDDQIPLTTVIDDEEYESSGSQHESHEIENKLFE